MNKAAQELGKLGGNKTKLKGKEYYSLIGKKGAKKRWNKSHLQPIDKGV